MWRKRLLGVLVALVLAGAFVATRPDGGPPAADQDVAVVRIVDGDTLVVTGGVRVRLIGINTPESVDPRRPVECFGKEAAAALARLVPPGTPVRLGYDVERTDRFGRTLAYVHRQPDGLFVNAALVEQGYAQPATYPPNVAHAGEFAALAQQARQGNAGLWSACPSQ
ncbi:MAG TPA: thermonuclease family protein [Acidimicrobiia bacterium]|jgi:micrococcal nuclease